MSEQENAEERSKAREFDPGWNDPPMFSYDSRAQYNLVKKPSLTKRIGLTWGAAAPPPQNSCDSISNEVLPASAPRKSLNVGPPPPGGPPIGSPRTGSTGDHSRVSSIGSEVTDLPKNSSRSDGLPRSDSPAEINLESVSSALCELADKLFSEREREKTELAKRLKLMENQWKDDKFPNDVQEKLYKLAKALEDGRVDEADQLQRGLMVDHSALCCSWMSAIRKMISETRLPADSTV
ncbi:Steroid receptor RNA activator [Nesidiocoris tenuis]|uniref:Steroid receptor RNA activator n=1 Tax=Nesidiocoris tenuis TaxID=355587 RepID=A0ABN7BEU9_9HEMI|nr:Steroid receptor RNA activator [Nesidiocoris tenuis]